MSTPSLERDYLSGLSLLMRGGGYRWPSLRSHRACLFLARQGQRFLVDFGTENAVEKAAELRRRIKALKTLMPSGANPRVQK